MCVVSATSVKPLMGLRCWSQQPATATTTTTAAAEADTASAAQQEASTVDNLPNIHNLTHNINISKSNLTLNFDIKTYNKIQLCEPWLDLNTHITTSKFTILIYKLQKKCKRKEGRLEEAIRWILMYII